MQAFLATMNTSAGVGMFLLFVALFMYFVWMFDTMFFHKGDHMMFHDGRLKWLMTAGVFFLTGLTMMFIMPMALAA